LVNDGNTPALELHIHFPAPPHAQRYEAHYQLPVRFDQPETAVIIETALLDRPLHGAFPELNRQAADRVVSRLLPAPPQSALIAEIERAFVERPALLGLSIDAMAKRLGLSRRTLQRRLSAEGLSFSIVQARVRMSVAEEWLRTDELSIEEIGERLGFADRRSFSQAFTRATGSAPSLFRKHARGAR
jgi:AraC-like DNA-binding protein